MSLSLPPPHSSTGTDSPRWRVKNIATHPFVVVVAVAVVCVSHLIFMHAHVLLFAMLLLLLLLLYFLFACLMFVLFFPNGFICGSVSAHLAAVAPSSPATPSRLPRTATATANEGDAFDKWLLLQDSLSLSLSLSLSHSPLGRRSGIGLAGFARIGGLRCCQMLGNCSLLPIVVLHVIKMPSIVLASHYIYLALTAT